VLTLIGFPAAQTATWAASTFGVWALLPVLPTVWLGIGAALCLACVATARLFQPRLSTTRPISMYSLEFAQWWLVSGLSMTSLLVSKMLILHVADSQKACMFAAEDCRPVGVSTNEVHGIGTMVTVCCGCM
jgi:hypothetical protein